MRLEDLFPEELLKMFTPEAKAQLEETVRNAEKGSELLKPYNAETRVVRGEDGHAVMLIITSTEIPAEVQEQIRATAPGGRVQFEVAIRPSTVQTLAYIMERGLIADFLLLTHKDDPHVLKIQMHTIEEAEYGEGYNEALSETISKVLEDDGFASQWTLVLDDEVIFESKPSISEEDVKSLHDKLEQAQSVDDILNL